MTLPQTTLFLHLHSRTPRIAWALLTYECTVPCWNWGLVSLSGPFPFQNSARSFLQLQAWGMCFDKFSQFLPSIWREIRLRVASGLFGDLHRCNAWHEACEVGTWAVPTDSGYHLGLPWTTEGAQIDQLLSTPDIHPPNNIHPPNHPLVSGVWCINGRLMLRTVLGFKSPTIWDLAIGSCQRKQKLLPVLSWSYYCSFYIPESTLQNGLQFAVWPCITCRAM